MDREDWMFRVTGNDDGSFSHQWRCGACGRRGSFTPGSIIPGHVVVMDSIRGDAPYLGGYTRLECHMEPVSFV